MFSGAKRILHNLGDNKKQFLRKVVITFPINIGGVFLQFGVAVSLGRILGIEEYGAYVYVFSWATILSLFISLSFDQVIIRDFPKFLSNHDTNSLFGYILSILTTMICTALLAYGILYLLNIFGIYSLVSSALVTMLIAFVIASNNVSVGVIQSFGYIVLPQLILRIIAPILSLGFIFVFYFVSENFVATDALTAYLCTLSVVICLLFLQSALSLKKHIPSAGFRFFSITKLLKSAVPIVLVSFTYLINSNIDILMIGFYMENSDVGVYRAANRGAAILGMVLVIMNQIITPTLTQFLAKKEIEEAKQLIEFASILLLTGGLIATLIMYVGSGFFLSIFGSDFSGGQLALKVLLIGSFIDVLCGIAVPILILTNREKIILWINLPCILLNVVLNLVLVEIYGILGAAIATSIAITIARFAMVYYVVRSTEFDMLFIKKVSSAILRK